MRHPYRKLVVVAVVLALSPILPLHALTWTEVATLSHAGGGAYDHFGKSVAVEGDVAVVGEPVGGSGDEGRRGVAYVFVRESGTWTEAAELVPSDSQVSDLFGAAIAIHGDAIAVGAPTIASNIGLHDGNVYVFLRPAGGWSGILNESARLVASSLGETLQLGGSVAFAGDSIVTNSEVATNLLFVFNKPLSGWSGTVLPDAYLHCSLNGGGLLDVSASGDVVVAGAADEDVGSFTEAGKAFVWLKPVGGWTGFVGNASELRPSDPIDLGTFGIDTAIDGTAVVIGTYYRGVLSPPGRGMAYVYEKPQIGWAGILTESAQLKGSDVSNLDSFSVAVSISGNTAVVGAPNGDYVYQDGTPYGAAYVFDRPSGGWSGTVAETAEFNGPQSGVDMAWYGMNVAISGGVIVVTADGEDVNGNVAQGAAHVYELQKIKLPFSRTRFLVEGPIRVLPGIPVEFRVRVEALRERSAVPEGYVVISDQEGDLCRAGLDASGEGSCALSFSTPGRFRVRGRYVGNAEFRASTTPALPVVVGRPGKG